MARPRKFAQLEEQLGEKLPYFLCGLVNIYGVAEASKQLGVAQRTLEYELRSLGITKCWIVQDNAIYELLDKMTGAIDEGKEATESSPAPRQ